MNWECPDRLLMKEYIKSSKSAQYSGAMAHIEEDPAVSTSENQSTSNGTTANDDQEPVVVVSNETRYLWYTRAVLVLVLVSVATAVSFLVYKSSRDAEIDNFETKFKASAEKLSTEFISLWSRQVTAVESFANEITSYATSTNSSWPNVALPDFEIRARYIMTLSKVNSVAFIPIVTGVARKAWERFSVANEGWLAEGLALQGIPSDKWDQESISILESTWGVSNGLHIPPEIFKVDGTAQSIEDGGGPYAPWWQFAPAFPVPSIVNYNSFSHPTRNAALNAVLNSKQVLVTEAWDYADESAPETIGKKAALNLFLQHGGFSGVYDYGPASDLYVPIFDGYSENSTVVAELTAYIHWQGFFENILLESDAGLIVVLENSCGQAFTYFIHGPNAKYVGQGSFTNSEYYSSTYANMEISTEYMSFLAYNGSLPEQPDGKCLYRVRIYPSAELEELSLTNEPRKFTFVLVSTFIFTCAVFFLYDNLVERRQKLVMSSAQKSGAVVASLFPKEVRDRLYDDHAHHPKGNTNSKALFLQSNAPPTDNLEEIGEHGVAIADLYPNCTVCFMDIVGFTKWSSNREPWQVFKLLETLYKSFDKSAKRLDVFKVETIGDCYVAVTGLPHAQEDHVIIMARFAVECIRKVSRVTHRLQDQLGHDTVDLTLRTGLHSGPVTAGVLRGTKARFQLFGDTVNTASRMESTGESTKIQTSVETANLLIARGKRDWVEEREQEVAVKGKGNLRTYWLQQNKVLSSNLGSCTGDEENEKASSTCSPSDGRTSSRGIQL